MIVSVNDFSMKFGATQIIHNLSFNVAAGETFGFLGNNGSGKTTTLRALMGTITPTSGTLLVDGEPYRPGNETRIGYLPEERGLYLKEKTINVMSYFARLSGLNSNAAQKWAMEYLERVDLADKAKVRLGNLSGGQQQKIQLGTALLGNPKLLVLDEPTKGLDPVNRQLLMTLIEEQKNLGASVILVTHQMDEVERLCSRILLLQNGRAEAYGTITEIQNKYGSRRIRVTSLNPLLPSKSYEITRTSGDQTDLIPLAGISDQALLTKLVNTDSGVTGFQSQPTSLDEIFVKIYGHSSNEDLL